MSLDTAKATAQLSRLKKKFDDAARAVKPWYPRVCTVADSDGADEVYAGIGAMPGMREWLGDRQFNELRAAKMTIANRLWEDGIKIAKTDLKDDRDNLYGTPLQSLANQAMRHPDKLVFELIQNGESGVCIDGQYFFDTDHVYGESGTQSNKLTFNATDHTAVTPTEFRDSFHQALEAMFGFKRDNGEPYHDPVIDPDMLKNFVALVPLRLWKAAQTGLTSALVGGGDSNIVLADAQVVPVPFYTSTVKWQLLKVDQPLKPFVFQQREALSRQTKGLEDDETKDVKFMATARYAAGYGAWWTAVQTEFN